MSPNPVGENNPTPDANREPDIQTDNAPPNISPPPSVPSFPQTHAHCEITCKTEKNWWDKFKPFVELGGIIHLQPCTSGSRRYVRFVSWIHCTTLGYVRNHAAGATCGRYSPVERVGQRISVSRSCGRCAHRNTILRRCRRWIRIRSEDRRTKSHTGKADCPPTHRPCIHRRYHLGNRVGYHGVSGCEQRYCIA